MSLFIELTTDAFQDNFSQRTKDAKTQRQGAGSSNVRRPTRGLEIKDDTYAIIKVVTSDGNEIQLVDSSFSTGQSTEYSNFIIQSVQEARMEKHQIVETFGESYIFFFGESPRFLDVQCILVDSQDFNWQAEFWENYDKYFRGTKLVEMGARTYLFYEDNIVEGYMLNAQAQKNSSSNNIVQLSFRLYLTNYSNVSLVGDPNFPVRGSLILPDSVGDVNKLATDRGAYLATLGANLQQAGFAGGAQFQEAIANGFDGSGIPPELYGIFVNAEEGLGDGSAHPERFQRTAPLRSLIADNRDEFTGADPSNINQINQTAVIQDEVDDLVNEAYQMMSLLGAAQNPLSSTQQNRLLASQLQQLGLSPSIMNQLGLGPKFGGTGFPVGVGGGGVGAGFGIGAGVSASFGATLGGGIRASAGVGIGGGLGFSGTSQSGFGLNGGFAAPYAPNIALANNQYGYSKRSNALAQLNQNSFASQIDLNYFNSFNNSPYYANGVQTTGGLTLGVGIGGGIGKPFSAQTFAGTTKVVSPPVFIGNGAPAPGGVSFVYSVGDPPPSGYGYNAFSSSYAPNYGPGPASFGYPRPGANASFGAPGAGGASISVTGRPSAFSMVSVGGTLTPSGLQTFTDAVSNF